MAAVEELEREGGIRSLVKVFLARCQEAHSAVFCPRRVPTLLASTLTASAVLLRDSVAQGGALVQQELSCPSVKW